MSARFFDAIGGKLADRWADLATPALVFWAGGLLAWLLGPGDAATLNSSIVQLANQSTVVQLVVLAAVLIGASASAMLVEKMTLPFTRLLEGYWPGALRPLTHALVGRRSRRVARDEQEWQSLASKVGDGSASADDRMRYVTLEQRLRRVPTSREQRMPTRLGDILRASETLPIDKYGLDPVKCWPRLWLLLPDEAKKELESARNGLDSAINTCLWGTLFIGFGVWSAWAVVAGLLTAISAYFLWACARAEVFADLVESTFDVHRTALYEALRWPLPTDPVQERASGKSLTDYLWRGSEASDPAFVKKT